MGFVGLLCAACRGDGFGSEGTDLGRGSGREGRLTAPDKLSLFNHIWAIARVKQIYKNFNNLLV